MDKTVAIIGTRGYPSYYGGFETLVRTLAPYLADQGWGVTVYGRDGTTFDDDPCRDPRIDTVVTAGMETKSLSTLSYGLSASIDATRRRPDVALVMNVANGYFLPALRARGIPTVVNVDGMEWQRAKWGKAARAVFKNGARLSAKFANHLVYDSAEIARLWHADFHRDGIYIPYGATQPGPLPPALDLASRSYALLVARLVPENSIAEFFDAAEKLSREWDVVIVGSSGYPSPLEERAAELAASSERIHWLGHISDDAKLFALWQHAGVYFHGHSAGGTNPALVQAMACGTPIVARDTVFNREVLGDTGRFIEAAGDAIADELAHVLADPEIQRAASSGVAARQARLYDWPSTCEAYDRALTSLVSTASAVPTRQPAEKPLTIDDRLL